MYSFNQRYRAPQWFGIPTLAFFGLIGLFFAFVFCVFLIVVYGWLGLLSTVCLAPPVLLIRYGYADKDIHFIRSAMSQGRSDQQSSTHGFKESE